MLSSDVAASQEFPINRCRVGAGCISSPHAFLILFLRTSSADVSCSHFHEHAVVSGSSTLRYSSTHRVAATEGNTFSHVQKRCEEVLAGGRAAPEGHRDRVLDLVQVRSRPAVATSTRGRGLGFVPRSTYLCRADGGLVLDAHRLRSKYVKTRMPPTHRFVWESLLSSSAALPVRAEFGLIECGCFFCVLTTVLSALQSIYVYTMPALPWFGSARTCLFNVPSTTVLSCARAEIFVVDFPFVPTAPSPPSSAHTRGITHPPKVRAEQALLTELESEWLNQFWVQGRRHAALHPWWRGPMALVLATWRELERRTALTMQRLMSLRGEGGQGLAAAAAAVEPSAIARAFETVLRVLEERRESRSRWASRFADPAYRSLPEDCAPVMPALWPSGGGCEGEGGGGGDDGAGSALPQALAGVISALRECYTAVYRAASGGKKAGSAKAIAAGAASNWELFRAGSPPASSGGKTNAAPQHQKQRHQGGGGRAGGKDGKKRPGGGGGGSVVGGRTGGGRGGGGGRAGGRGPKRKRSNKRREG